MKKAYVRLALVALLTVTLLVAGCGQPAKYVRIGTASMGGAFYPMGNALAQLFNEKIPNMKASAQALKPPAGPLKTAGCWQRRTSNWRSSNRPPWPMPRKGRGSSRTEPSKTSAPSLQRTLCPSM